MKHNYTQSMISGHITKTIKTNVLDSNAKVASASCGEGHGRMCSFYNYIIATDASATGNEAALVPGRTTGGAKAEDLWGDRPIQGPIHRRASRTTKYPPEHSRIRKKYKSQVSKSSHNNYLYNIGKYNHT